MAPPRARVEASGPHVVKTLRARQLRRDSTEAERRLWATLRRRSMGCRVRRQHVVLGWIVDFFVPAARLVIEVDGDVHDHRAEDDQRRTDALAAEGLRVLRFRNEDVLGGLDVVVDTIATAIAEATTGVPSGDPPSGA